MLESAVYDRAQDLWLEEEVPETGAVDGDVGSLHGVLLSGRGGCRGPVGPISGGGCVAGLRGLLLLLVVQKLSVGNVSHREQIKLKRATRKNDKQKSRAYQMLLRNQFSPSIHPVIKRKLNQWIPPNPSFLRIRISLQSTAHSKARGKK
jgi:hypothetical protein